MECGQSVAIAQPNALFQCEVLTSPPPPKKEYSLMIMCISGTIFVFVYFTYYLYAETDIGVHKMRMLSRCT